MSIAVVAATHKECAQALLESVEMICGAQDNVKAVSFYETEDGDILKAKLEGAVEELNGEHGVLFLVDLFGGTPFNAAYMAAQKRQNVQIVAGLNMPMLVEALMSRESMDLPTLAEAVKKAGVEGIRSGETKKTEEDDE